MKHNPMIPMHLFLLSTISFFFCISLYVVADSLTGDVELLKTIANGYKANYEKINNMQGDSVIESEFYPGNDTVVQKTIKSEFIADKNLNACRWFWKPQNSLISNISTGESKTTQNQSVSGMVKDNSVFRFKHRQPNPDGSRKQHVLEVRSQRDDALDVGVANESFDPYYFFQAIHPDLSRRLLWYYENAKNPKLSKGSVIRNGDIVVFQVGDSEEDVINRYTFDLSRGCNLIEYYGADTRVQNSWKFDYQEIDGVFVPFSLARTNTVKGELVTQKDQIQVEFKNLKINNTVSPDEFSIEKLGIQTGDVIDDRKVSLSYIYGVGYEEDGLGIDEIDSIKDADVLPLEKKEIETNESFLAELDIETSENPNTEFIKSGALEKNEEMKVGKNKDKQNKMNMKTLFVGVFVLIIVLVIARKVGRGERDEK